MKKFAFLLVLFSAFLILCGCVDNEVAEKESLSIKYLASEGGTISGDCEQVITTDENGYAKTTTVTAIPNDGYEFSHWNDGYTLPNRSDIVSESKQFTAYFTKTPTICISYVAGEGGYISGDSRQGAFESFTTSTVTAIASDGYKFIGWDDGLTTAKRSDTVASSQVYTAIFKKIHTINFISDLSCGLISGLSNQYILDGNSTTQVTAMPRIGYKFSHWSNGQTAESMVFTPTQSEVVEAIFVKEELSFPILSINTYNYEDVTSTSEYLSCDVSVSNAPESFCFDGVSAKIRGRGNSTWEYEKKPYKLKFNSSRDMFGAGNSREWVLLTNYSDLSLSRNFLAQNIASLFDSINSTSSVQFVELYLNNEYLGVYLLCEQIEVRSNKIDISESEDDVDTGYLIELDGRKDGDYVEIDGKYYVIKSPSMENEELSPLYKEFISNYLTTCLDALKGQDYKSVCELIDVESFSDAYIVHELFNCVDVGYASFFMYKDKGDKLYCGPVWDFDRSLGIVGHSKGAKKYDTLWAKQENVWFNYLLQFDEFKVLVSKKLLDKSDEINKKLDECYKYLYANRSSIDRNFLKWRILGTFVWPNDDELTALDTWDLQVEYTRTYLNNSLNYLLGVYTTE